MPRPIELTVLPGAMRQNLEVIRRRAGTARVWAVVKARGYGHGIDVVARGFAAADGFALLDLEEAVMLREAGVRQPILLLEGIFGPEDVGVVREYGLSTVIHNREQLGWLQSLPSRTGVMAFVKINTGMNRLGFEPAQARDAWLAARRLPGLGEVGLMTHFANADEVQEGPCTAPTQLARFDAITESMSGPRSVANSAALIRGGAFLRDWVRPGIILYGSSPLHHLGPSHTASGLGLAATQVLKARLISVRQLQAGEVVGYGSRFVAPAPMRIGVVACGYADGYPRHAGDGTPVAVDGVRTRLVGRVSMDMITVDLTGIDSAAVGSEVELWGSQIPIDEVATHAGTIAYELMCAITPRVPRRVSG